MDTIHGEVIFRSFH